MICNELLHREAEEANKENIVNGEIKEDKHEKENEEKNEEKYRPPKTFAIRCPMNTLYVEPNKSSDKYIHDRLVGYIFNKCAGYVEMRIEKTGIFITFDTTDHATQALHDFDEFFKDMYPFIHVAFANTPTYISKTNKNYVYNKYRSNHRNLPQQQQQQLRWCWT